MLQAFEVREGHRVTKKEVRVLQTEECKQHGGKTLKGSLTAKLQSAADRNAKNAVTSDPKIASLYQPDTQKKLTKREAARITSMVAKNNKGVTPKGSFAALAQSAADKGEYYKENNDPISAYIESTGPKPITKEIASSIQSSEALKNNGKIEKGSFAALVQSAADKIEVEQAADDLQQQFSKSRHPVTKQKEAAIQSKSAKKKAKGKSTETLAQSEADRAIHELSYNPNDPNAVNSNITARAELAKSSRENYPTYS